MKKAVLVSGVMAVLVVSGVAFAAEKTTSKPSNNPNPTKIATVFWVNGKEKSVEVEMVDGERYIPIKLLHELTGAEVDDNTEDGSVAINTPYQSPEGVGTSNYINRMHTLTLERGDGAIVSNFTDNLGGTYGLGSIAADETGFDATYYLGSKYKSLQGKLVPSADWSQLGVNKNIGELEVLVNGKVVYDSGAIRSDIEKPIGVNVDLNNANKVEIKIDNVPRKDIFSSLNPKLGFVNVQFVSK